MTNIETADIVVAGHTCVDIIPAFDASGPQPAAGQVRLDALLTPGKLVNVGPVVLSTGGSVPNTGLALKRLGVSVRMVGKLGPDFFGQAVIQILEKNGAHLADDMVIAPGEASSYTIVINPPGIDRIFLHCPGANDSFCANDLSLAHLAGAKIFHFGYPPLMQRMYSDGGDELIKLLRKVKQAGLVTSLDMARPDPDSPAGKVDWPALLAKVLPLVDFFVPSLDETLFMLDRAHFNQLVTETPTTRNPLPGVDGALLSDLTGRLIRLGATVVMLKMGDQGLVVRTSADSQRMAGICQKLGLPTATWIAREVLVPCFKAKLVGTTGAGDATIAGFLTAVDHGQAFEAAVLSAAATGACSVEAADANSAIPSWEAVQQRLNAGWQQHSVVLSLPGWQPQPGSGLWLGEQDQYKLVTHN